MAIALWSGRRPLLVTRASLLVALVFCGYHLVVIVSGYGARACGCFGERLRLTNSVVGAVCAVMLLLAVLAHGAAYQENEQ